VVGHVVLVCKTNEGDREDRFMTPDSSILYELVVNFASVGENSMLLCVLSWKISVYCNKVLTKKKNSHITSSENETSNLTC